MSDHATTNPDTSTARGAFGHGLSVHADKGRAVNGAAGGSGPGHPGDGGLPESRDGSGDRGTGHRRACPDHERRPHESRPVRFEQEGRPGRRDRHVHRSAHRPARHPERLRAATRRAPARPLRSPVHERSAMSVQRIVIRVLDEVGATAQDHGGRVGPVADGRRRGCRPRWCGSRW